MNIRNKEKILLISSKFHPIMDGLSTHATILFQKFSEDFDVDILTSRSIETNKFSSGKIFNIVRKWSVLNLCRNFRSLPEKHYEHIVIEYVASMYGSRGGINFSILLFFLYLRIFTNSKISFIFHELYFPFRLYPKYLLLHISHRIMLFVSLNLCHFAFFSTERNLHLGMKNAILDIPSDWIPSYSAFTELKQAISKHVSDKIEFSMIGNDHPTKNTKMVLECLCWLSGKYHNIHLNLIGPSSEEFEAKGLLPKDYRTFITFFPKCDDKQVEKILTSSHYLLAYFTDGISTRRSSVTAALSQGLPVISTSGPYTEEFFKNREGILLFDLDENGFSRQLENLITEKYVDKGQEILDFYHTYLSVDVAYRKILALWKS